MTYRLLNLFAHYSLAGVLRNAADAGSGAAAAPAGGAAPAAGAAAPAAGAAATAGGAAAGNPAAAGAWYGAADLGFDDPTREYFAGKNFPDAKTALLALPNFEKLARDRNVVEAPNMEKLGDWAGWEKLGWNKDAAKYAEGIKRPESKSLSPELFDAAVKAGHELKAPPHVVGGIYGKVLEAVDKMLGDAETANAAEMQKLDTALRGKWGGDFDRNKEFATRTMKHFGLGANDSKLLDQALGSAGLVEMFHTIGQALGEDKLVTPSGGGAMPASVDAINAELNKLAGDAAFMEKFRNNRHPQHADAVAQRQRLLDRLAAAEKAAANRAA